MTHLMYPDDGGLAEPQRPFEKHTMKVVVDHFTVSKHVKGISKFQYYRDSALWYKTDTDFLFPVPTSDIGTTTFNAEYKSIKLMRWIRMYIEELSRDRSN